MLKPYHAVKILESGLEERSYVISHAVIYRAEEPNSLYVDGTIKGVIVHAADMGESSAYSFQEC